MCITINLLKKAEPSNQYAPTLPFPKKCIGQLLTISAHCVAQSCTQVHMARRSLVVPHRQLPSLPGN